MPHMQDVAILPMKTALQRSTELMRRIEEAAREELHLYNDYFVDVLFRSMLPQQRVHTPLSQWLESCCSRPHASHDQ